MTRRFLAGVLIAVLLAVVGVQATPAVTDVAYQWCSGWLSDWDPFCWFLD
jgi:hypothetical protein